MSLYHGKIRRPQNVELFDGIVDTDYVCKDVTPVAIRKKIRRAFRFAQQWGEQFHGSDFDFLTFYQTDDAFDINKIQLGVGDDVLDLDFHDAFVVDMDPQ